MRQILEGNRNGINGDPEKFQALQAGQRRKAFRSAAWLAKRGIKANILFGGVAAGGCVQPQKPGVAPRKVTTGRPKCKTGTKNVPSRNIPSKATNTLEHVPQTGQTPSGYKNGVRSANSTPASSVNAQSALRSKLSALENAQQTAARTRTLPDGRIRYYSAERSARTPGPTRGNAHVTEWNPKTGHVRSWEESYNHAGDVTRVHPKTINGQQVLGPHYPPTGSELSR